MSYSPHLLISYKHDLLLYTDITTHQLSAQSHDVQIILYIAKNKTKIFVLIGAAIAGVYKAAGKRMISLEALVFGVGQSFCVLIISFLRVLATL